MRNCSASPLEVLPRYHTLVHTHITEVGLPQRRPGSTMSSDFHHIPILPAAPSLTSHLQALDLLAARLSSLSIRAEWETRVPLNAKASIKGTIVNTGTVKINVGGEWWVDMTPQEGEAWVRRRKAGEQSLTAGSWGTSSKG